MNKERLKHDKSAGKLDNQKYESLMVGRARTLCPFKIYILINFIEIGREGGERARGREKERGRKTSTCCSTYLCSYWFLLFVVVVDPRPMIFSH